MFTHLDSEEAVAALGLSQKEGYVVQGDNCHVNVVQRKNKIKDSTGNTVDWEHRYHATYVVRFAGVSREELLSYVAGKVNTLLKPNTVESFRAKGVVQGDVFDFRAFIDLERTAGKRTMSPITSTEWDYVIAGYAANGKPMTREELERDHSSTVEEIVKAYRRKLAAAKKETDLFK
jgi:hypothetical protein